MAQPVAAERLLATDVSAKARILGAALELFAERGVDATPMRTVATAAGVTVGLIVHHYGTKEALREAVELAIVSQFAAAIASVPLGGCPPEQLTGARDRAVAQMLAADPSLVDYLRRALLDSSTEHGGLVSRLSQLSAQQVHELREAGIISTKHTIGEQVISIMVRQLGRLFLQPLIDRIGNEFADDLEGRELPQLVVTVTR